MSCMASSDTGNELFVELLRLVETSTIKGVRDKEVTCGEISTGSQQTATGNKADTIQHNEKYLDIVKSSN